MEEVHQLHWPAVNESHRLTSEKKPVGPMRPVTRRKASDSSGQVPNFRFMVWRWMSRVRDKSDRGTRSGSMVRTD